MLFRVIHVNRVILVISTKTSPKGEFECLKAASTKCEWLEVWITVRILNFGVFRFMELIFLIFHAEADTCWSARCARSGLVVSNSIIFFRFMGKFIKKSLHSGSIRKSCYLGHFRSFLVIFGHFGLFFPWKKKSGFDNFIRFLALALKKRWK